MVSDSIDPHEPRNFPLKRGFSYRPLTHLRPISPTVTHTAQVQMGFLAPPAFAHNAGSHMQGNHKLPITLLTSSTHSSAESERLLHPAFQTFNLKR